MRTRFMRLRNWIPVAMLAGVATGFQAAGTDSIAVHSLDQLYVFDMGTLKNANPQPLLDRGLL